MLNQLNIRHRFEGRILIFQVAAALLLLLLFVRLIDLQLYEHEGLLLQADKNRTNIIPLLPTRGIMVDRNGTGLALNHISYKITVIPERVEDMEQTLTALQQLLQWQDQQLQNIRKRIARSRSDRPVLLADKLRWEHVAPLSARLHHFSGIDVVAGTHRFYPYGELASHLVGYLSLAGPKDLKRGYLRTEHVGRSGLERAYESLLHGRPGSQQEETDAKGRRVAVLKQIPPTTGENIQLSIDIALQKIASEALGRRTGAVVVMDVNSGELLTLLSKPGFDTNHFITGLEYEQWQSWLNDPRKPLLNRTTQAAYPPASTLKMIAGFAGLKHRIPLASGSTQCPGYLELADRNLRCWNRKGHEQVNLYKSLVRSCDVYFYELGDQLGMQRLTDEAHLWGFGEATGIVLTPESRGLLPAAKQLRNGRARTWYRGETMITAIGQGATTVTPIQMARFAAAIANGGKILVPQLLADSEPIVLRTVDVEAKHLDDIRKAMRDVVATPKGTAHRALNRTKWKVAGKTGTAQVIAMAQDDEEEEDRAPELDHHKDHAWFMGYAPFDKPEVAIAVFVEHGGHGGSDAAPVAREIVRYLAAHEQVKKGEKVESKRGVSP